MIELRLFGGGELRDSPPEGDRGVLPTQPKRLGLLAYLAAETPPWGVRSRDTLLGLFWPELDERRARASLNQAVYQLRQELGQDVIVSHGESGLALSSQQVWCDVPAFREALERGDLEEALRLHRAPALEGFYLTGLGDFERWVDVLRATLRRDAMEAAWTLSGQSPEAGEALAFARRALEAGPELDERGLRRMLELRDRLGDRSGALRDYETFATRLSEEYGADPAPETAALMERIRSRSEAREAETDSDPGLRGSSARVADSASAPPSVEAPQVGVGTHGAGHGEATQGEGPRHPGRSWLVAVSATVLVLGAAWLGWPVPSPPEPTAGRIAVVPFQYVGVPGLEHTAEGAAYLLAANLDEVFGLATVDPRALSAELELAGPRNPFNQDPAREAAQRVGAEYVLTGSVTRAGETIRISALMAPSTDDGEGVRATVEGLPEELFSLVDRVSAELLAARGVGAAEGVFRSAARTTESFAALNEFVRGEAHYRAGRHAPASESYRAAIALDSTFSLAWMRLSQAQNWLPTSAIWASQQALRHASRLSGPAQREVEAWALYLVGNHWEAEQLYGEVLRHDSSSLSAWVALGEIDFHWGSYVGRPMEDARSRWERAAALDPANAGVLIHLARIAAREGRQAEFEGLRNRILALSPPVESVTELSLIWAFNFGTSEHRQMAVEAFSRLPADVRFGLAQSVASVSWSLEDVAELLAEARPGAGQGGVPARLAQAMMVRAGVLMATGRLARADALLDTAAIGNPHWVLNFRVQAALAPLAGSNEEQLAELAAELAQYPISLAAQADPTTRDLLYLRGILAARLGRHEEATEMADALEAREDGSGRERHSFLARLVRTESLRTQGRPQEALAVLERVPRTLPTQLPTPYWQHEAVVRFLRAELLAETGRPYEAIRWFATFPDATSFDIHFLPAAQLRIAQLLRSLGRAEEAEPHLERLHALWRHAEPAAVPRLEAAIAESPGRAFR